jgi:hypothetical protein
MTRIPQRAFSGGIMAPGMYPRRDLPKWMTGLKDAENVTIRAEGGLESRAGTKIATGYDNSTADGHPWLIPFEASADDTYMLEFGEQVCRPIRNGGYLLNPVPAAQSVVGVTEDDPAQIEMATSVAAGLFTVGRLVYLLDPNGTSAFHRAVLEVEAISGEFITFKMVGGVNADTTVGEWGTIGSGATLQEVYQFTSPYEIEDLPLVQFTQDVDTMFFSREGYDVRKLVRTSDTSWAFSTVTFQPEIGTVTGQSASAETGSGSDTFNYKIAAVSAETGEEGLPSAVATTTNDLSVSGNRNEVTWSAVTGAGLYRVYKEFNGVYGFIGITEALTFLDENITPDTADTPQTARNPFSGASDKPRVTAFIENRLTFASSVNNPQAVEMSNSVAPLNFNRATTPGGSDAISFRMRSTALNRVLHIVDGERPVIFTAGAEWYLRTTEDEPIVSGNFSVKPVTKRGSAARPRPVPVGSTILHVDRSKNSLREFSLADGRDTPSADLTILAKHLFRQKEFTSMAFAQSPHSIIWATMDDGALYSLTYLQEHEIWGWTRHVLGGTDVKVKQVETVTEGSYDVPYFVVERTLQGETVTLVERLDDRDFTSVVDAYFVDCGSQRSGSPVSALRGYLHLRGEAVSVLADGNVLEDIEVDETGQIDLGLSASDISVGLGYAAWATTLDADLGDQIQQLGSSMGRYLSAVEVAIKVVDTRGIAVGREGGELTEVTEFTGVDPIPLATKTHVITIDGDWSRDQAITVRQNYPLPMTITAIAPSWEIEDDG